MPLEYDWTTSAEPQVTAAVRVCVCAQAGRNGATGVELDLEFSADGVPVLMHDETVDRTTNGSGALSILSLKQLLQLDAAAKHRLRCVCGGVGGGTRTSSLYIHHDCCGGGCPAVGALLGRRSRRWRRRWRRV